LRTDKAEVLSRFPLFWSMLGPSKEVTKLEAIVKQLEDEKQVLLVQEQLAQT
jgi:hypothetical protein